MTVMSPADFPGAKYRPPAPFPLEKKPGVPRLLYRLWRNPLTICGERHFDQPIVAGETGIGHITVVSEPSAIRRVLVDRAENYPKDARQMRILKPGLRTGLLTADGEKWRIARRTLAPLFSPRGVELHAQTMLRCSQDLTARLSRRAEGRVVDVNAEMARVTFAILSKSMFSDSTQTDVLEFSAALNRYFNSAGRVDPLDAIGAPAWIPRLGLLWARPAIRFFERLVEKIVAERRRRMAAGDAIAADILTLLLRAQDPESGEKLSDSDVAGSIITFIGAGHETTANTLAWTLFLLAKHPSALAAVQAEIDRADSRELTTWPDKLVVTRAVVEEAMRLYPPAPVISRTAIAADVLGGVKVPKGSTIIVSPYIVHRHKTLWSEPDYFRPERFMPGFRERIPEFAYLPFGAGPRICIGQRFSQLEAIVVLATLLRSLRFTMPKSRLAFPVHRVTLRPVPAINMSVFARRHAGW